MITPSNDSINPGDLDRCKECGVEHFVARTGIDHDAWGAAMFNLGEQKLRADRAEADRDRMRWAFEAAKRWAASRDHISIDRWTARELELKKALDASETRPAAAARDGKWTCSSDEEHWNGDEEFDSREEAEAYVGEFGAYQDLEDGATVWVGQIKAITPDDLARHGASADRVIEDLDEHIYELVGDAVDNYELAVPKGAERDLDERLAATIRDWMLAHGVGPRCWTVEHVKEHTWHQCEATTSESGAGEDRCIRHDGHEGEHEWP